jgi:thioredoxin 1
MKELNDNNFEEIINNTPQLIVDFYADWCQPCKIVGPILEELSLDKPNIVFTKCNVDKNPGVAIKYQIRSIPTIMYFKDGKLIESQLGANPKQVFENRINLLYS